jgi:release factor glutamine methyltransferase
MTLKTALLQGQKLLEDAGVAAPRLTAEVLLAHAVQRDRQWLVGHSTDELIELWWIHYGRYLHQRIEGTPTQYITGHQEFYGRDFRVTPDVLIPRPETEHLIEAALAIPATRIVDVGTGSGCIAATLAYETKARVFATEISRAALAIAAQNAPNVTLVESDLLAAFADASFDLVISNPPYVPQTDHATLQREVRDHEPPVALYGGSDGLEIYRRLIPEAARVLQPGGHLIMEFGWNQAEHIGAMLTSWREVQFHQDLAGLDRMVIAQRP